MLHSGDGQWQLIASIEPLLKEARPCALLCCTFRHYEQISNLYGAEIAEQLLDAGRHHLRATCPRSAQLIRLGPATLAVVLSDAVDRKGLEQLAHRCAASWRVQQALDHTPLLLTLAIGAAQATAGEALDAKALLSRAQLACQIAQRRPGSQVEIATAGQNQHVQRLYEHEAELHLAIQRRELTAYLQPIVNLKDGAVIGFECLARWPHRREGVISPAAFLEPAIDAGISAEIDLQVLSRCLEAAPQLAQAFGSSEQLVLSANISAQLVENPRKIEELLQLLEHHLHTSQVQLQLELLEESLNESSAELDDLLNALARLGVLIAIDDFGTGYSSLSRVHNLAINTIKVDRSFVERINDPRKPSNHLLKTLMAIGHDLQINLTAEGVQTPMQQQWLLEHGCNHAQGFLFSEPLSLDEAITYLEGNRTRATS